MKKHPDENPRLVTERDIDEDFGLFVEDSYPDSIPIPRSIKHEKPDGTETSNRGNSSSS